MFDNAYQQTALKTVLSDVVASSARSLAVILCVGNNGIDETIDYHLSRGFEHILLFVTHASQIRPIPKTSFIVIDAWHDFSIYDTLNTIISGSIGKWIYWGFNNEYLFYPYSDTRSVNELADFVSFEQRRQIFGIVLDAYGQAIDAAVPTINAATTTFIDKTSYFRREIVHPNALELGDDRQLYAVHGGLRWRYSHLIANESGRVDRVCFFKATSDLRFDASGWTTRPEFHTMAARTHDSPTLAVISLDTAQKLLEDPVAREQISGLTWQDSVEFNWTARELMQGGLILPGQWF